MADKKTLMKKWNAENKERKLAWERNKYATNPEYQKKSKQKTEDWRENNPDKLKQSQTAQNERYRNAREGTRDAQRTLYKQVLLEEPTCRYCGMPSTQVDHIMPLSKGGTDDRNNLAGSCVKCNGRKYNKLPEGA